MRRMHWTAVNHQWCGRWKWIRYPDRHTIWVNSFDETLLDHSIATAAGADLPGEVLMHIVHCARDKQPKPSHDLNKDDSRVLGSMSMVCQAWRRICFPALVEKLSLTLYATTFLEFTQFIRSPGGLANFRPHVKELSLKFGPDYSQSQLETAELKPRPENLGRVFARLGPLLGSTLARLDLNSNWGRQSALFWHPPHLADMTLCRSFTALSDLHLQYIIFNSSTDILRILACLVSLETVGLIHVRSNNLQRHVAPRSRMRKHPLKFHLFDSNAIFRPTDKGNNPLSIAAALPFCWTWALSPEVGCAAFVGMNFAEARAASLIFGCLAPDAMDVGIEPKGRSLCMFYMRIFQKCRIDHPVQVSPIYGRKCSLNVGSTSSSTF